MNIVLYVRDSKDYAIISVNALRALSGVESERIDLYVLDNASEDGLRDWAVQQEDLTYIYMDEGYVPVGKAVNMLVRELEFSEDFVFLTAGSLPVPGALSKLRNNESGDAKVSMTVPVTNVGAGDSCDSRFDSYEEFAKEHIGSNKTELSRVLSPYTDGFLIDIEAFKDLGGFDEELEGIQNVLIDLALRSNIAGYKVLLNKGAAVWKNAQAYESEKKDEFELLNRKWNTHYFNISSNRNIVTLAVNGLKKGANVLEVGCDMGATLLDIKNKCENVNIYGTDINETAVRIAGAFANTCVSDIEKDEIFEGVSFDRIIFGDVLEHLRDPESVLKKFSKRLSKGGSFVISVPNLMHISVMKQLLNGYFTYTETGLLDKTHIHFFTYKELIIMLERIGGKVEFMGKVRVPMEKGDDTLIGELAKLGDGVTKDMFETYQYVVTVRFEG